MFKAFFQGFFYLFGKFRRLNEIVNILLDLKFDGFDGNIIIDIELLRDDRGDRTNIPVQKGPYPVLYKRVEMLLECLLSQGMTDFFTGKKVVADHFPHVLGQFISL